MGTPVRSILAMILCPALIGCAGEEGKLPFDVVVAGPVTACTIKVGGRQVTDDELSAIASSEAGPRRKARIAWTTTDLPYRCVGGVIYTLQKAGFETVEVVAPSIERKR